MNKIALVGGEGVGKSTLAERLLKEGYVDRATAFAEPIKQTIHLSRGSEPKDRKDKEENYRKDYIALGEAAKKEFGEDYWINKVDYSGSVVISDARFEPEFKKLKEEGFTIIYLEREAESGVPNEYDLQKCVDYIDHIVAGDADEMFTKVVKILEPEHKVLKLFAAFCVLAGFYTVVAIIVQVAMFIIHLFN